MLIKVAAMALPRALHPCPSLARRSGTSLKKNDNSVSRHMPAGCVIIVVFNFSGLAIAGHSHEKVYDWFQMENLSHMGRLMVLSGGCLGSTLAAPY